VLNSSWAERPSTTFVADMMSCGWFGKRRGLIETRNEQAGNRVVCEPRATNGVRRREVSAVVASAEAAAKCAVTGRRSRGGATVVTERVRE